MHSWHWGNGSPRLDAVPERLATQRTTAERAQMASCRRFLRTSGNTMRHRRKKQREGRCRGNRPRRRQPGLEQAFDARQAAVKGVDGTVDGHQVAAVTEQHEDPEDNEKHDKK